MVAHVDLLIDYEMTLFRQISTDSLHCHVCVNDDVDVTIVVVTAVVASDDDIDDDDNEVFDKVGNMVLLIEQDVIDTNFKYESIILLLLS